ncbi:carbamoyltransferase [Streptomyces violarus]|uniref:Carbamoyltransferase n=1 Tax=Streptomyces violarus TaxID=67380 RepID=A0A7W4ZU59_9ACTN|nr:MULTISPECIES: carbamoyltransferase HypF [Streptomyces]MBB3078716.1 hydrogenase maturation protein HypF [Streptomyces violarus]WRU03238.1 carbamoyltransferase HypF [Streptomyces sp. CGMCC 4.1772]GHD06454.1 carbamoyltransferase [Streptomyces violarus]
MTAPATQAVRRRVTVRGTVQGVGFRPFVHRLATDLALAGFVSNTASGVLIEVEGPPEGIADFCDRLAQEPPPLATVTGVGFEDLPVSGADDTFSIRSTDRSPGRTLLPPDTATCPDCLRELADPADRRHRHPFVTCTHCGPRFTIATDMPYDRAVTTMAGFPMCADCGREYGDPGDRRFHAQPVACPGCGPRLRLVPASGSGVRPARDADALAGARALLAAGRIVAVKGLGGYHLACDATDARAVETLRTRKARGGKPFAVMCADLDAVRRIADPSTAELAALTSARRPIVLLRRRAAQAGLAPGVCPGSPHLGVMLPYTPVHTLLFGLPGDPPGPRVLVMTSGNRSGEPIVTDDDEALTRLAGLADAWLAHDRPISSPCDDSLLRVRRDGTEQVLRRSRGYVPRPLRLPVPVRPTLAVGGDLKNALCLGEGDHAWFGPHIGDMGDLTTLEAARRAEAHMRSLTGVHPELVAADRHPGYHSARWARRRAHRLAPVFVQHHHAHIASAMAQHGLDGTAPVIGVAFDGTGYGDDGTVWGGEILLADYTGYRRFAHLAPAPLPGGDAGVANPCRLALARLWAAGLAWDADLPSVSACAADELAVVQQQLTRGVACVATSSMGRLFDAVSSLVGVCHRAGYEAQAALELEAAAASAWGEGTSAYDFGFTAGTYDPAPVLNALVADLRRGTPAPVLAARFHRAVARAVAEICRRARQDTGLATVALSGGVFANALLEEECARLLSEDGFAVLRHGEVPPNDGGLALGQLVVAAHLRQEE